MLNYRQPLINWTCPNLIFTLKFFCAIWNKMVFNFKVYYIWKYFTNIYVNLCTILWSYNDQISCQSAHNLSAAQLANDSEFNLVLYSLISAGLFASKTYQMGIAAIFTRWDAWRLGTNSF